MRLFLCDNAQSTYGPYGWKLVREFYAFGILEGWLGCEEGAQEWLSIASFPKVTHIPKTVSGRVDHYLAMPAACAPWAFHREVLRELKAPPIDSTLNRYAVNALIALLIQDRVGAIDPKLAWRFSVERNLGWKSDPASAKQVDYLRDLGIPVPPSLTKGEAACLLGARSVSEPQLQRLGFYGCPSIPGITAEEGVQLIDDYQAKFPESEKDYQQWKATALA